MTPLRRIRRRAAGASGAWPDHVLPLLRRVYAARGAADFAAARPRLADLHAPDTLTGIADAARLLADAIAAGRRIVVVGDFDCDGATACAVAVRGLRMLGAREVLHAVPNRIVHGYGLSPGLVDELAALGPELLLGALPDDVRGTSRIHAPSIQKAMFRSHPAQRPVAPEATRWRLPSAGLAGGAVRVRSRTES